MSTFASSSIPPLPPLRFQSLRVRSNPTLAHVSPPAATSAHITLASWPRSALTQEKSLADQHLTAPSYELVTKYPPNSGSYRTELMSFECAGTV